MPPVINKDACTVCGICVKICPMDVFFGSKKKEIPTISFGEECWHCNACVLDCPSNAISLRVPLQAMMLYVDAVKHKRS